MSWVLVVVLVVVTIGLVGLKARTRARLADERAAEGRGVGPPSIVALVLIAACVAVIAVIRAT